MSSVRPTGSQLRGTTATNSITSITTVSFKTAYQWCRKFNCNFSAYLHLWKRCALVANRMYNNMKRRVFLIRRFYSLQLLVVLTWTMMQPVLLVVKQAEMLNSKAKKLKLLPREKETTRTALLDAYGKYLR